MAEFKLQKREVPLAKIEPALGEHLKRLRSTAPESANFLARRLFGDTMVPGVGNKLAYEDFISRQRKGGVHALVDANDFGQVNKLWGQSAGDDAIKAMGGALMRASRANRGKLFRVGGDEFRAYFEQPEQAHSFLRHARKELEALPPIQGQHRHSVSVGLAQDPDQAEQALILAKRAKQAAGYAPGHAETHAHSLLPGAAGPVAVSPRPEIPFTPASRAPSPVQGPAFAQPLMRSESAEVEELRVRRMEHALQKMAVLHAGPGPVPVYRVQNDEGKGPYETGAVGDLYGQFPLFDRRAGSLPETQEDFEPHEYDLHRTGAVRSAFLSPKDAGLWFGAGMLGGLRERGFTLRRVLAQKVWRSRSGKQVLFQPHGSAPAEPVDTRKSEPQDTSWFDAPEPLEKMARRTKPPPAPEPQTPADSYAYHGTSAKHLRSIARQGLIPKSQPAEHGDENRDYQGDALYFTTTPDRAAQWGDTVLRFPHPEHFEEDAYGDSMLDDDGVVRRTNYYTANGIDPEHVHVQHQGGWLPIREFIKLPVKKSEPEPVDVTLEKMAAPPKPAQPAQTDWDRPRAPADWARFDMPTKDVYDLRAREVLDADGRAMPTPHVRRGVGGVERLRQLDDAVARDGIRDPIEIKDYGPSSGKERPGPAIADGHHRLMVGLMRKLPTLPVTMHPDTARKLGYGPDGQRLVVKAEPTAEQQAEALAKTEAEKRHALEQQAQEILDPLVKSLDQKIATAMATAMAPVLEKLATPKPNQVEFERDAEGRVVGMKLVRKDGE